MTMFGWGIITMLIGALLFLCGTVKSQNFVYQLLVKRSQILFGKYTYIFHQVSGILVMIYGLTMALGMFD